MANIVTAYLFWFFGGQFGLHHFYLGRDKQAFIWWMSFGGLGLGWLRDLWRMPEYLCDANEDPRYLAEFAARRALDKKPRFCFVRFLGQILIGAIFGYLFRLAIPEVILMDSPVGYVLSFVLPIMGSAVGVNMVANVGNRKVEIKWCIIGAMCGLPWLFQESPSVFVCAIAASAVASKQTEWDPDKKYKKGACNFIKRVLVLTILGIMYSGLWCSVIYYNAHVTTADGTSVPVNEAVHNFFKSPAWKEFKKTMSDLYEFCQVNGWGTCYQQLIESLDPKGELNAYKTLEFDKERPSSDEEIQSRCRKLSRKWHPDRYKKEAEKAEAQEKFIEIQQACDILNGLRKKRAEKNMQSDTSTPETHQHQEL